MVLSTWATIASPALAERAGEALEIPQVAVGRIDRRADALHRGAEVGDHGGELGDRGPELLAGVRIAHHVVDVVHRRREGVEEVSVLATSFLKPSSSPAKSLSRLLATFVTDVLAPRRAIRAWC